LNGLVVGELNADTLQLTELRDDAMATTFWLLLDYNFGCMIAIDTLFLILGGEYSERSSLLKT